MFHILKKQLKPYVFAWRYRNERKKLKNKQFTIISDNCWGGENLSGIRTSLPISFYWPFYLFSRLC